MCTLGIRQLSKKGNYQETPTKLRPNLYVWYVMIFIYDTTIYMVAQTSSSNEFFVECGILLTPQLNAALLGNNKINRSTCTSIHSRPFKTYQDLTTTIHINKDCLFQYLMHLKCWYHEELHSREY